MKCNSLRDFTPLGEHNLPSRSMGNTFGTKKKKLSLYDDFGYYGVGGEYGLSTPQEAPPPTDFDQLPVLRSIYFEKSKKKLKQLNKAWTQDKTVDVRASISLPLSHVLT